MQRIMAQAAVHSVDGGAARWDLGAGCSGFAYVPVHIVDRCSHARGSDLVLQPWFLPHREIVPDFFTIANSPHPCPTSLPVAFLPENYPLALEMSPNKFAAS